MKAPITKAPKIKAKLGDIIELPINTTGMKNVCAITLNLKFDPTIIRYIKTVYADELTVEGAGFHNVVPESEHSAEWRFAWSQLTPISQKVNESLVIIQFECVAVGTSPLTWDLQFNEDCEYATEDAVPMEEDSGSYINGYVKVSV